MLHLLTYSKPLKSNFKKHIWKSRILVIILAWNFGLRFKSWHILWSDLEALVLEVWNLLLKDLWLYDTNNFVCILSPLKKLWEVKGKCHFKWLGSKRIRCICFHDVIMIKVGNRGHHNFKLSRLFLRICIIV